jgi:peptide/nickel transport system permease protein
MTLDFIAQARIAGAGAWRIITRHLLPNTLNTLVVLITLQVGYVIIVEASLSFLGLGPQLDYTWGAMLDQARNYLWNTDWVRIYAVVPGLAIAWVVAGANLMGDGLRDRLDPRQRARG